MVRHLLNIRFGYPAWRPALAGTLAATVIALYAILTTGSASAPAAEKGSVSFADVRHVIDRRCGSCHSAQQSDSSRGPAPGGVMFDRPEQIVSLAARIEERAVITRTMPPSNKTGITDEERGVLERWVRQGARP